MDRAVHRMVRMPLSADGSSLLHRDALDSVRASLLALPEDEVQRAHTLEANAAAVMAEASAKKLEPHRAALVAQFGESATRMLDELLVYARATQQADIELAATEVPTDLSKHHDEVRRAYQLLITDADALANRGHLDATLLESARDIQGYQALIKSTLVLAQTLRAHWSSVTGRSPLTLADLDHAELVARRMAEALGDRAHGVSRAPAAELRARALSKLVAIYEEVRRMMTYLRWYQDDADTIVPSLWSTRGRRGRSRRDDERDDDDTDAPFSPVSGPVPNNGGPAFPINGGPAFPNG